MWLIYITRAHKNYCSVSIQREFVISWRFCSLRYAIVRPTRCCCLQIVIILISATAAYVFKSYNDRIKKKKKIANIYFETPLHIRTAVYQYGLYESIIRYSVERYVKYVISWFTYFLILIFRLCKNSSYLRVIEYFFLDYLLKYLFFIYLFFYRT